MLRRKWYLFAGIGTLILFIGSIWRNKRIYRDKSGLWVMVKSCFDIALILLTALKLPRLLIAWISFWITKPIKNTAARISTGIGLGLILDFMAGGFLEGLLLLGVFAIDFVTGKEGFLGFVDKYDKEEKMGKAA